MKTEREFAALAPWENLRHAYGSAGDIPAILEQVSMSTGSDLYEPLEELCSRVLHQGTIYSASAPAVRALLEMAAHVEAWDRSGFYELLSAFADSARMAIEDGPAPPSHAGGHPDDGEAIRVELDGARKRFESDLDDPDPKIRELAVQILTAFRNIESETAHLVKEHYAAEENQDVRNAMLSGLVRVHGVLTDWPRFLETAAALEPPENRFLVRCAQVVGLGRNCDDAIVHDLVTCFVVATRENQYAFSDNQRFYEALRGLGSGGELAAMLQVLKSGDGEGLLRVVAEHLLRLVFADRRTGWGKTASSRANGIRKVEYWGLNGLAPEPPAKLSDTQRSVLLSLADQPRLWEFRTNLWELFHLPGDPEGLHQFVREH